MKTIRQRQYTFRLLILLILAIYPASSLANAQSPAKKIHPVILVHGINTPFTMWKKVNDSIYYTLEKDNYDMNFVVTFAYMPESGILVSDTDPLVVCTVQGNENRDADVKESAKKLELCINWLIDRSKENGGPDYVDIVAHSLGGLVTREYIGTHQQNNPIRKFIDLATPHSGVPILNLYNNGIDYLSDQIYNDTIGNLVGSSPLSNLFKPAIKEGIHKVIELGWEEFNINRLVPNPSSAAGRQLDTQSPFMKELNGREPLQMHPDYSLIYGDIQLGFVWNFFGWKALSTEKISFGDMVVGRDNASTIPNLDKDPNYYHVYPFPAQLEIGLKMPLIGPPGILVDFSNLQVDRAKLVWHNGLLENQDVNRTILSILNETQVSSIINTPIPPSMYANSSTAMLFDVSGSMGENDATGITKIDAAKNSGDRILDIIQAENSVSQGADIGILSFSNGAWVNANISSDVASARSALNGLYPLDGTGMPDGMRLAIDQLSGTQNAKPIIIMLSDGLPNIALGASGNYADPDLARQQSLDLASEAGSRGICIYTVGFGIPYSTGSISGEASIDEDFLKQVAVNSGCGAYYNAQNATQLANVYVNLRHLSTGNILLSQTGNISQGQTVDIANVQVPDNQSMILFTLNWPGSQLDAVLTDPSGTTVDSNYLNASFSMADTLASVIIQNPQPGDWKVAAKGVDVPEGTTTYNAVLSTRPNPNPPTEVPQEAPTATVPNTPGFPVVILILVVAGGGIAVYVLWQTKTKGRSNTTAAIVSAQLVCISGELTGQSLPLRDRLLVGRGSGSGLKLTGRAISRQHAIFRFSGGNWYIQDMNSKSGIFVNDARVNATVLRNGDRVRIGSSVFEFRVTG